MDATLDRIGSRFNLAEIAGDAVRADPMRLAWAELLSRYSWDCFGTHTYRPVRKPPERFSGQPAGRWGMGPDACMTTFKSWISRVTVAEAIDRGLASWKPTAAGRPRLVGRYANAFYARRPSAFAVYAVGIEKHRSGLLHMHSLIRWPSMLPDLRRDRAWADWFQCYGRGEFQVPKDLGVLDYVSKYVVKGGAIEVSPSFDAASMAASA